MIKVIKDFFRSLFGLIGVWLTFGYITPNPNKKQCLLPGCNNMTTHRGGYCCPEHKEIHRRTHRYGMF
jgi:hypothetical protein